MTAAHSSKRRTRGKGEVNEIRKALDNLSTLAGSRPEVIKSKRETFSKLIKYMTTGIDMSGLFVPAMKCCALSKQDLPLKKMLYLYLRSTARQNSEVSLLVVQQFLNDTNDVDPRIRGLAVRSMCSLRVPELLESVFPVVSKGLKDPHAYVREVSVIGVLKCYEQDEEKTVALGLIDGVKELMTTERDTQVVTSCLYVLRELCALHSVPRQRMISFMNNVRNFSEWGQCLLMETLLEHYRPETEAERFDVLEVLDFGLNHTNSAVIMATAKLFLHYTSNYKEQYDQVIRLILGPVRTLIMGREPEVAYAVLRNVHVLAERQAEPFRVMVNDIFYRPEDTTYLKIAKLDLMVVLSNLDNAYDTAEEAFEYARDFNDSVASHAVACISRIAIKVGSVDGILDRLLLFLNHRRQVIVAETVIAFAAALHKFPGAADICVPSIARVGYEAIGSPQGRAAFIWILGHFGEMVQDAPYLLEDIADDFNGETAPAAPTASCSSEVKHALLTAAVDLFCVRPAECLPLVKNILAHAIKDQDHILKEKALLYAKLLQGLGAEGTRQLVHLPALPSGVTATNASQELQDILFDEWNTLSVIYGEPSSTFIAESKIKRSFSADSLGAAGGDVLDVGIEGTDSLIDVDSTADADGNFSFTEKLGAEHPISPVEDIGGINGAGSAPAKVAGPASMIDDLDLLMMGNVSSSGDVENGGHVAVPTFTESAIIPSPIATPATDDSYGMKALRDISIGQEQFKNQWNELELFALTAASHLSSSSTADFDRHIEQANLKCIGKSPSRFLFYGCSKSGRGVLVCITISSGGEAALDVRSEDDTLARTVLDTLGTLLSVF